MNLYVHFPFCRAKCAYCALLSRVGSTPEARRAYCTRLAADVAPPYSTIYFGGGSPALCDLTPLFEALRVRGGDCEFTVELHPLDARPDVLEALWEGGVNRISMGVQSLDDDVLKAMGRLHTAAEAEAAFRAVRAAGFTNAGIDLIAGCVELNAIQIVAQEVEGAYALLQQVEHVLFRCLFPAPPG